MPLLVPKNTPLGSVGSIDHDTTAAPDVDGYKAIIGEYCASSAVLYGYVMNTPVPFTVISKTTVPDPPVLLAQIV